VNLSLRMLRRQEELREEHSTPVPPYESEASLPFVPSPRKVRTAGR